MITFQLTQDDLLSTRLAYSAMLELTLSRRLFHIPHKKHNMGRWLEDARQAINNVELP